MDINPKLKLEKRKLPIMMGRLEKNTKLGLHWGKNLNYLIQIFWRIAR